MKFRTLLSLAVAGAALCAPALAQYPTRPVTVVVPFTPGGSSDITARNVGQKLSEVWGQPVLVEIAPHAAAQVLCFAYVDDRACGVFEQVDAGDIGEERGFFAGFHGWKILGHAVWVFRGTAQLS